jgi:hypothetical protein
MTGRELIKRVRHLLYATALFLVVVPSSPASARTGSTAEVDPCSAPNVRTDIRPDAGGPPTPVPEAFT